MKGVFLSYIPATENLYSNMEKVQFCSNKEKVQSEST